MFSFDEDLRTSIAGHIGNHERVTFDAAEMGLKAAAVAIVLTDSTGGDDDLDHYTPTEEEMAVIPGGAQDLDGRMDGVSGGAAFLLCRRATRMSSHAAQWALPGGRMDPGETAVQAAIRETHEELGVLLDESSVVGVLDDYPTRSGYVMTPVVLWGGAHMELNPNPDEVFAAYSVSLRELSREDSPRFVDIEESDRPVVQVAIGGDLIHAPTGAVLLQFRWVGLEGKINERVHEFEQPVFAWK